MRTRKETDFAIRGRRDMDIVHLREFWGDECNDERIQQRYIDFIRDFQHKK